MTVLQSLSKIQELKASPDRIFVIQSPSDTWPNNSLNEYKVVTRVSPMGIKPPKAVVTLNSWTIKFAL